MTWTSIFIAGLITYFTRMGMITLIDKDVFNENFRKILNYVPSVVFPSIIFPGIFLDDYGSLVAITDPKIYGALTAIIIGYFSVLVSIFNLVCFINFYNFIYYFSFSKIITLYLI